MGYNFYAAFLAPAPKPKGLCVHCIAELTISAGIKFKSKYPDYEGEVNVQVSSVQRLVVVTPLSQGEREIYTFDELGFSNPC